MKDNEIEILINGEKTDIFDAMDYIYLKPGEYIYKDNDKWYVKKNKRIVLEEDKKIEKLDYVHPDIECSYNESQLLLRIKENKKKINEIIDYINKGDK